MKYRKKPVVVEAYKTDKEIVIHTLEGDMKASIGDYIITGINGEQYPCKPDIFEKTYEAITNTNYDLIKAMSIDELAKQLVVKINDGFSFGYYCLPTGNGYLSRKIAEVETKQWLEQEVSE